MIIATDEELWLLTKSERRVYEMYRLKGLTKEQICVELNINQRTFDNHWSKAMKKITDHRKLMENPLKEIAKGNDILRTSSRASGCRRRVL